MSKFINDAKFAVGSFFTILHKGAVGVIVIFLLFTIGSLIWVQYHPYQPTPEELRKEEIAKYKESIVNNAEDCQASAIGSLADKTGFRVISVESFYKDGNQIVKLKAVGKNAYGALVPFKYSCTFKLKPFPKESE